MAKILYLIQREFIPPTSTTRSKVLFPIETAFGAAYMQQRGHEIRVFDLNFHHGNLAWEEEYDRELAQFQPDFIVSAPQTLSFFVNEHVEDTYRAFKKAKALNPKVKTLYCGAHVNEESRPADMLSFCDQVVKGEYDEAIALAVDGKKIRVAPGEGVMDSLLDQLPFPAYKEFHYERYFAHPGEGNLRYPEKSRRYTHYQTTRGCACRCSFCNIPYLRQGHNQRHRAVNLVVQDLLRLKNELGIEEVHFLDDNLTLYRKRAHELFTAMIEARIDLPWIGSGGLNIYTTDEEILDLMWKAGCYRLNLAIESGDQELIDKKIRKPVKLERDIKRIEYAKSVGFEIVGYFILGFPGETRQQLQKTLDLAGSGLFDYVTLSLATPLPGTPLWEEFQTTQGFRPEDYSIQGMHRRSHSFFGSEEVEREELEWMRAFYWEKINFGTATKREKAQRMLGLSAHEVEELVQRNRRISAHIFAREKLYRPEPAAAELR